MRNGVLIAVVMLLWVAPASARDWVAYSSDNFTIFSNEREPTVINVLTQFEVFRVVALTTLGLRNMRQSERLKIVMYGDRSDFRDILHDRAIAGAFIDTEMGPRMLVGPGMFELKSQEILFHEYVHHLLNQHSSLSYPRWYQEGLAELLQTTQIYADKISVGHPSKARAVWLRESPRLSANRLITSQDRKRQDSDFEGRFYASAWLFTHFLSMNAYGEHPEYRGQLADYLKRFAAGEDPEAAFQVSFGCTSEEMDSRLDQYQRQRKFVVLQSPNFGYHGTIEKRVMPAAEAAVLKSELAMSTGQDDLVLRYLADLRAADVTRPEVAAGFALRAVVRNHKDDIAGAAADSMAALNAAPRNAAVLAYLLHYESDIYDRMAKAGQHDVAQLRKVIELGRAARDADTLNPLVYFFLARAYEAQGDLNRAIDTLGEAYGKLPPMPRNWLELVRLLVSVERFDEALPLAEQLYGWAHREPAREMLSTLIDQIKRRQVDPKLFDQGNSANAGDG